MKQSSRVKAVRASAGATAVEDRTESGIDRKQATGVQFTDEEIAARAYTFWAARGFEPGRPDEDWYRAIEELTSERNR